MPGLFRSGALFRRTHWTFSRIWKNIPDMSEPQSDDDPTDRRIALRLRELRAGRGWSLDRLAAESGVSRATLSRLENGQVGPTTAVLARLCTAYGLTLSRLIQLAETEADAVVRRDRQPVWVDRDLGFRRRQVSPPAASLSGEVLECLLDPGARIDYEAPPRPGLEHHLVLLDGRLDVTVDGRRHALLPGDCLRYRLDGASRFEASAEGGARYHLFLV